MRENEEKNVLKVTAADGPHSPLAEASAKAGTSAFALRAMAGPGEGFQCCTENTLRHKLPFSHLGQDLAIAFPAGENNVLITVDIIVFR